MPRVTLTFARFTLIVAVGLTALLLPLQAFASGEDTAPVAAPDPGLPRPQPMNFASVSLTSDGGSIVCHHSQLRVTVTANKTIKNTTVTKLRWTEAGGAQQEYNYTTHQGPTPPIASWTGGAGTNYGDWNTWTQPKNEAWTFAVTVHVTMVGQGPPYPPPDVVEMLPR